MDNPPERTRGDAVHALVKSMVSAVPTAGGPLSVLMETVFAPPIERRRGKWFTQLAEVVSQLEKQVADLTAERLSQNEIFVTIALQATQIALRNHHEEKLSALRGAVLHAGFPGGPDEQLQLMFLQWIDELAPTHLAILSVLSDPVRWMEQHHVLAPSWAIADVSRIIEYSFPALRDKRAFCDHVVRDLQTRGLMHEGEPMVLKRHNGQRVESYTTEIADEFIAYISEGAP